MVVIEYVYYNVAFYGFKFNLHVHIFLQPSRDIYHWDPCLLSSIYTFVLEHAHWQDILAELELIGVDILASIKLPMKQLMDNSENHDYMLVQK